MHLVLQSVMRLVLVLAWLAALVAAGWALKAVWRWTAIRTRRRVTCDEAASAAGKRVLLVGRTAAGPLLSVPGRPRPSVASRVVELHERTHHPDYVETTEHDGPVTGDEGLYGVGGARVLIDPVVGRRPLVFGHDPMMIATGTTTLETGDLRVSRTTFEVSADRPVIALGTIRLDAGTDGHLLTFDAAADGSIYGDPAELARSSGIEVLKCSAAALATAGLAFWLSVTFGWGPVHHTRCPPAFAGGCTDAQALQSARSLWHTG